MLQVPERIVKIQRFARNPVMATSKASFTSLNVESLKGVLSYLSHLYSKGEISEKAFDTLVKHACSVFIENEVEQRVSQVLEVQLEKYFRL